MQNKCDICHKWNGSCYAYSNDDFGYSAKYVCPDCLMWSEDTLAKMARARVRPAKGKGKNGNKQK